MPVRRQVSHLAPLGSGYAHVDDPTQHRSDGTGCDVPYGALNGSANQTGSVITTKRRLCITTSSMNSSVTMLESFATNSYTPQHMFRMYLLVDQWSSIRYLYLVPLRKLKITCQFWEFRSPRINQVSVWCGYRHSRKLIVKR